MRSLVDDTGNRESLFEKAHHPTTRPHSASFRRVRVWRLRISDFRGFYDVEEKRHEVVVRAIRRKGANPPEGGEDDPGQRHAGEARPGQEASPPPGAVASSLKAPGAFPDRPVHDPVRHGSPRGPHGALYMSPASVIEIVYRSP